MHTSTLEQVIADLTTRPGHERVRSQLFRLLTDGLRANASDIDFERRMPEAQGRADALFGRTIFEIKRDLRKEREDAETQLARYLPQREHETGRSYLGVATDGNEFLVYRYKKEKLDQIQSYKPTSDNPRDLLVWLESLVLLNEKIAPDPFAIRRELGRESVTFVGAFNELNTLWHDLSGQPDALLKYDLWNRLIRSAYGSDIANEALFIQHTYLTVVAKSIATYALFDAAPSTPSELLDGELFRNLGVYGAVESDFFDWVLHHESGRNLVQKISAQISRFDLSHIEVDVLKNLYESLIDPEQRRDLGEYYTPDWLAKKVCDTAIENPATQRVIDPSCGSGTFLFHAIRRLSGDPSVGHLSADEQTALVIRNVGGIDVHPVAVIFARVTYLLALLPLFQKGRPPEISIPVYLGDALQWNARHFINQQDLEIIIPRPGEASAATLELPDDEDDKREIIRIPSNIARNPALFDSTLNEIMNLATASNLKIKLTKWLERQGITNQSDVGILVDTAQALANLINEGRNHIWGYVTRNLSRPIWLAAEPQKADVIIGNPPWLDYRSMATSIQKRFYREMKSTDLWDDKVPGLAFDLSAYFFARSTELYLKRDGVIAFVMPYAAMTRKAYAKFRTGRFHVQGYLENRIRFYNAWALPSDVQPVFRVPCCVLFAQRAKISEPTLPEEVTYFQGNLPHRDATEEIANKHLNTYQAKWPETAENVSPYRSKFRAGAKLDPRRLILVQKVEAGRLGQNPAAPLVRGRTGKQDKKPWREVDPPEGAVEREFIKKVLLGENIAPYRTIGSVSAVVPWDQARRELMSADQAAQRGFSRLADWLGQTEHIWNTHGKGKTTFKQKIDYSRYLSSQFPIPSLRVVYSKSGTLPAATVIYDREIIIDHKLYWAQPKDESEAYYLVAILNSETGRARSEHWQSEGQWGKRDFDKAIFNLMIPAFDAASELHVALSKLGRRAEEVASTIEYDDEEYFTTIRRRVRDALVSAGISEQIDRNVERLLKGVAAK